jgi:hypothetical protein
MSSVSPQVSMVAMSLPSVTEKTPARRGKIQEPGGEPIERHQKISALIRCGPFSDGAASG